MLLFLSTCVPRQAVVAFRVVQVLLCKLPHLVTVLHLLPDDAADVLCAVLDQLLLSLDCDFLDDWRLQLDLALKDEVAARARASVAVHCFTWLEVVDLQILKELLEGRLVDLTPQRAEEVVLDEELVHPRKVHARLVLAVLVKDANDFLERNDG